MKPQGFYYGVGKYCLDITIVIVMSWFWFPIFTIVLVLNMSKYGLKPFFIQKRAMKGGKTFGCIKFKTMRPGLGTDAQRTSAYGKWLRKFSLDELPQLFQVIIGQMSLVGPRPLPIIYLPLYSQRQHQRHFVKPGITGWAQVNGRNAISWSQKFELDLWYVQHLSLSNDLKILFKTINYVLGARGVNASASETMPPFNGGN